jgi:hypothetical protein
MPLRSFEGGNFTCPEVLLVKLHQRPVDSLHKQFHDHNGGELPTVPVATLSEANVLAGNCLLFDN